MHILFIADPLEQFKIYKDTTFSMMREAQRRGHRVSACEPRHLVWESGGRVSAAVRDIRLTGDEHDWFEETANRVAALKEFEQSQVREPNRLRGYAGAATAAAAAGDADKARLHYAKLIELTRDADTPLPDIARAKTYLAAK